MAVVNDLVLGAIIYEHRYGRGNEIVDKVLNHPRRDRIVDIQFDPVKRDYVFTVEGESNVPKVSRTPSSTG